jgi:hypothetical protein
MVPPFEANGIMFSAITLKDKLFCACPKILNLAQQKDGMTME